MKKYSILIVGIRCYYGHIREFIVNLKKKNPLVEISLVSSPLREEAKKELNEYVDRFVIHKSYCGKLRFRYFVILINVFYYIKVFLGLYLLKKHFDIVDIHFPNRHIKFAMPFLKMMSKNIVITPWGSDVLRVEEEKSIIELGKIYAQAKYITLNKDSQLGQCVMDKYKVNPDKMVKLDWGGEFFDYVQENSERVTSEAAKARFGLSGKYVITCGYNTQREQRHEQIIDAIFGVRDQLPDNTVLLFPFTYGRTAWSDKYTEGLKEKCRDLGLVFVAVEENLDMLDLLKLRMSTDIFVHVQTTDAGSRCVMEYVACNKKVVHGSWIKYAYLEDYKPSCYFPVDRIENVGECIVDAYHSTVSALPKEVKKIIMERGWNYKMALWNTFFESLV